MLPVVANANKFIFYFNAYNPVNINFKKGKRIMLALFFHFLFLPSIWNYSPKILRFPPLFYPNSSSIKHIIERWFCFEFRQETVKQLNRMNIGLKDVSNR